MDQEEEIRELLQRSADNRREFIRTELQTSFIALDRAKFERSRGNVEFARHELAVAMDGVRVVERFLAQDREGEAEFLDQLARLKTALQAQSDL